MVPFTLMKMYCSGDCVVLLGEESGDSSGEKRHNSVDV